VTPLPALAGLDVVAFGEPDAAAWQRYVDAAPEATCYHRWGWKRVVERTFGVRTHYLAATAGDGTICGVLPLALLSSVAFGRFLVSLPYFNYGGVCAADERVAAALVARAAELARDLGAKHVEFRNVRPDACTLPVKTSKVSMRLALPADGNTLWNSFPSKLRSQIKRPQKAGMTARFGGLDVLDDFYAVFAVNMRDLGTPVYSRRFFENILREFPESASICVVYADRTPVAAGFVIGFRDMLEIPWASSLREFNSQSPNMLLYWSILEHACERGYRVFDFGRCTVNEGTYRFKEQWGARPVQLYWHYWLKNGGSLPEINPHNPRYAAAIRMWQRLPVRVATLLGPSIVKHLP